MPSTAEKVGRSVLICHDDEPLNRYGLAQWLASFTELQAVVVIEEPRARLRKRIQREVKRIGMWRFLDVLAFRFYSRLFLAPADRKWTERALSELQRRFPPLSPETKILFTASPNSAETESLLGELQPDIIIARCKNILNQRIFGKARIGTFVMHPGICPEYRNAHGCFWALANRDMKRVGMTLLRVDPGVDTGPVYGHFTYPYDECRESHNIIQARVVFDNLAALETKFREILAGTAATIDVTGRKSQAWGQPWLTSYLRWKRAAQKQGS